MLLYNPPINSTNCQKLIAIQAMNDMFKAIIIRLQN